MEIKVSEFYNTDYVNYASYDNYRKIASYVDGLKVSARKVIWTVLKGKKDKVKVSVLCARTAEQQEYLHGEQSLYGVIVGLGRDYCGSNNIPLVGKKGNYGDRLVNDASAGRYIYAKQSEYMDTIFTNTDEDILVKQEFEGTVIEPQYLLPILPLIVINGSDGLSTGFAQKILPRKIRDIVDYIDIRINNRRRDKPELKPFYRGFGGEVKKNDSGAWEFHGVLNKKNTTTVDVTELPPQYNLRSYTNELIKLEDAEIIEDFRDLSSGDSFKFVIKYKRTALAELSEAQLKVQLKLIKKVTENFTVLDENNKIVDDIDCVEILLDRYIDFRLKKYIERKKFLQNKMEKDLRLLASRYNFINGVVNGKIIVNNIPEVEITKQLDSNMKIIKSDGKYDYLLNMPLRSVTKERYIKIREEIGKLKDAYVRLKSTTEQEMWVKDLKQFTKACPYTGEK